MVLTSFRNSIRLATLVPLVWACSSQGEAESGSSGATATTSATFGSTETGGPSTTSGLTATSGSPSTAGTVTAGTDGSSSSGTDGAATGAGGTSAGAAGTTGGGTGGLETGGSTSGEVGSSMGGSGTAGAGGSTSGGGSSGGTPADGNDPVPSAGCGQTRTLQNGSIDITYANASRKYILRVPDSYDSSHPYRLVLAYAWSGGSAEQVVSTNYFTFATLDGTDTIFAAPDAADGAGTWSNGDVEFTDAILAELESDLCIDTTRIFASGFSFGGGMAMALACTRANVFRGVAFFSGADLTGACPTTLSEPIAYYASQASEDAGGLSTTSPITGEYKQAQFAELNGCTPVPESTTFPSSGQPHKCTYYEGCSAGHPTEYCVFNGAHGWEPVDPGESTSWNAPEAWKFITQF